MTTTRPSPRINIEPFSAEHEGASVHVRKDDDLEMKFEQGQVATATTGQTNVAMVLNVDSENIDLIVVDSCKPLVEVLSQIREAAELALDGLRA